MKPSPFATAALLATAIALPAAPPPGSITRHVWTGVGGNSTADLTGLADYPDNPDISDTLGSFHTPVDWANNYGTRVFGWVHAPVTGNYTFSIHSDDNSELWLSTTSSPDERRRIASVPEWTSDGQWDKFASQSSDPVRLEAGHYYFIEAIQKEGSGGDNLGVAWAYPGQSRTYIPGSSLSPWQNLPPEASDDTAHLPPGGTVTIPVLANDLDPNGGSDLDPATLSLASPAANGNVSFDPTHGLATYIHSGSGDGTDSFDYEIRDSTGLAATATVHLTISSAARLPLETSTLPDAPPPQQLAVTNAFPGISFSQPLCIASPPGESNRVFVLEKGGDMELIADLSAPSKTTFLDLDALVNARPDESFQTGSEQGLIGLAFHPDYASNGRFFVVYSVNVDSTRYQRLSEFAVSAGDPNAAATDSELILLQQLNDAGNHNGGDLHFGPDDGYLYMSWGDEGGANDEWNNSQKVDLDFWSSITRIDVDLEPEDYTPADGTGTDDSNLPPNPHPAIIPDGSGNPRYEVPAGNPFIGATSFNGLPVTPTAVRTEFWAVGLRNPWRISFDPPTGDLWCGDVGQGQWEEVDIIVAGGNYEWAFREGDHNGPKWNQRPGDWPGGLPPLYEYGHGSGEFQGNSITGGVVYRGNRIPSLYGSYIFADYVSGNIWALDPSTTPPAVQRIAGEGGLAGFGHDPSNGDILAADINSGMVRRLVVETEPGDFPPSLEATGLFADLATLAPNPGLVAYDINLSFWSDHAIKSRWFGHPDAAAVAGYAADDNWTLPEGMIWVKHFDLELERGNPATKKRIETRVLVKTDTTAYGVSYRWNEDGTATTLADAAGEAFDLQLTVDGSPVIQHWQIPSQAECMVCHTQEGGHALSFRTRQLNRPGALAGMSGNYLDLLSASGYLSGFSDDPSTLPRHVAAAETDYSLETRARSWIDVNCSYCHQDGGNVPATWDGLARTALFDTGMVNGIVGGGVFDPADRLLVPGQEEHSVIVHRAAGRNGYTRMPPLASSVIDETGVQLLIDWIESELPARQSYDDWRTSRFGSSPDGEPTADPDNDGRDNRREFLELTDPLLPDPPPSIAIAADASSLALALPDLPGRGQFIESSVDMSNWSLWPVEGNDGLARPPGAPIGVTAPLADPQRFFRTRIEER